MIRAIYINKITSVMPVVIILLFLSGCNSTSNSITRTEKELNTDRPGSDIATLRLELAKPQLCSDACNSNSNCAAWVYVKPGILGPHAVCRLKDKAPDPIRSSCCISGIN